MAIHKQVLAMILAGGEGKRLFPLTLDRAKPAVPFGGKYRIIDFVLNNFANSGIYQVKILTQFKSDSLNRHIARTWPMGPFFGHYTDLVPAQMRIDKEWYLGTADAIYQNLNLIYDDMPDIVCVFGGDHIYRMDVSQMVATHREKNADVTIAAIPVPVERAREFGVIEVDEDFRIIAWQEKPKNPKEMPGRPGFSLCSMGNYIFQREALIEETERDAADTSSKHDFGHNVIPHMIKSGRAVYAYDFYTNEIPGVTSEEEQGYWRDVGDIDSYWEAHMDLVNVSPVFNLYNGEWPIRTHSYQAPPAKFVFDEDQRRGTATDSLVSDGCIISGGRLHRCVLSPHVRINSFSHIEDSILMHGVNVGRYAVIKKAIIDKGVEIPPNTQIGVDTEEDKARGFTVSPGGVTVVAKGTVLSTSSQRPASIGI
ncbi:MAG: glucose-1-phosphate adenylyltransferase [Vampirovibrionales bacterium]|nr:glucose-1-phosphate adenylyltransferase [Vampirovibrionales bacterium]